ncbi:MAG: flagellar hook-length control protein FliK [Proteobacteria bacterium]|nr:flagellar hook-length control protein FliK [Pseudomonadota bacterium]
MTNPIILKLMSSLLDGKTSVNGKASGNVKPLNSGKGNRHFLSDMIEALNASKKDAFHMDDKPTKINTTSNNKGYKYYLESFKKGLLSQGKPLNKTFLKEKDLPLIKTFLFQCGFSHEKVERFLKDLKANNSNGEFNLSQIFLKITELGTPKRKEQQDETVAPATVPYIESVLRDFNLTPKELDGVFSKARIEGGGLDLHKLVEKLKGIKGRRSLANKTVIDQKLSRQISDKMEMIGMNIPKKGNADQISLDDFIASLEKITEKVGKEKKVSPDIKNTLDKILERVELSGQKSASASSVKVSPDYHFTESLLKEEINKKGRHAFNEKKISSLEKNKSGKNEYISSFLKQKDVKVMNQVGPNADTSNHSGKGDFLSNLNKQTGLINPVKEEGYHVDTEAGQINVPKNTEAFNFTNTLKTVEHGEKPFRGYLPASLVDQVGKQISRSILRGDQVVTLQLKPSGLGTVRIKMDIKDHTLRLSMTAEHHSVKELLLNNVHELKEALVQHGVKLEKVDVQINSNFGQSLNASKEGTDNGQGWTKDFNGERFHSDNHTEGPHERPINIMSGSNLLDLVA